MSHATSRYPFCNKIHVTVHVTSLFPKTKRKLRTVIHLHVNSFTHSRDTHTNYIMKFFSRATQNILRVETSARYCDIFTNSLVDSNHYTPINVF